MSLICYCPSYKWPHRRGGGSCIWSKHRDEPLCEECGQPCEYMVYRLDEHERSQSLSPWTVSSKCCGAAVVLGGQYLTSADA